MKVTKLLSTALATGALTISMITTAGAATLFEHQNYSGQTFSASNAPNVGSLNDKA